MFVRKSHKKVRGLGWSRVPDDTQSSDVHGWLGIVHTTINDYKEFLPVKVPKNVTLYPVFLSWLFCFVLFCMLFVNVTFPYSTIDCPHLQRVNPVPDEIKLYDRNITLWLHKTFKITLRNILRKRRLNKVNGS